MRSGARAARARAYAGRVSLAAKLGVPLGAFAAATAIAAALGAPNLGTAMTFGQLAFAATAIYILVRR